MLVEFVTVPRPRLSVRELRRPAAPGVGRAHLLLVRAQPVACRGSREPRRNFSDVRYPRLCQFGPAPARPGAGQKSANRGGAG